MIRIELQVALHYDIDANGADFIFNVHAAHTRFQVISAESLTLSQSVDSELHADPVSGNRYLRLHAGPGRLSLRYQAIVDMTHQREDPDRIPEVAVRYLPANVLCYLYPSRYCQSDRLGQFAIRSFGHLPQGYRRVLAIRDWVVRHIAFRSNTSNSNTSAVDTLIDQVGVCRDFAHVMIALCRALSIPARLATGTDYGSDPALGPPDFHAYVEVYLGGRWYIFDPSGTAIPMGLVRVGTGRDAADVAFATIFGTVVTHAPEIRSHAVSDAALGTELPWRCEAALSTDDNQRVMP